MAFAPYVAHFIFKVEPFRTRPSMCVCPVLASLSSASSSSSSSSSWRWCWAAPRCWRWRVWMLPERLERRRGGKEERWRGEKKDGTEILLGIGVGFMRVRASLRWNEKLLQPWWKVKRCCFNLHVIPGKKRRKNKPKNNKTSSSFHASSVHFSITPLPSPAPFIHALFHERAHFNLVKGCVRELMTRVRCLNTANTGKCSGKEACRTRMWKYPYKPGGVKNKNVVSVRCFLL